MFASSIGGMRWGHYRLPNSIMTGQMGKGIERRRQQERYVTGELTSRARKYPVESMVQLLLSSGVVSEVSDHWP